SGKEVTGSVLWSLVVVERVHRVLYYFFFFQAEDGIRVFHVTGVQTCALPIFVRLLRVPAQFDPAHDQRSFTVAASDYVSLILLRPLLEEFYREAPGLSVTVVPVTTGATGTLAALEGGQIDLAIMPARVAENESPNSHRRSRSLFRDRFVPAVWP